MTTGKIISYTEQEGGYIQSDNDEETYPFTLEDLSNLAQAKSVRIGMRVRFELEGGMAGISAKEIVLLNEN